MKRSKYQLKKDEQLKNLAISYYKQGLTTRQVGKLVGKSHAWVAGVVKKI